MGEITFTSDMGEARAISIHKFCNELNEHDDEYWHDITFEHNGWNYRWSTNGGMGLAGGKHWTTLWFDGVSDEADHLAIVHYDNHYDVLGLPQLKGKWNDMEHSHDFCFFAWQAEFDHPWSALRLWQDVIESPALLLAMVRKYGEPRTVDEVFEKYGLR